MLLFGTLKRWRVCVVLTVCAYQLQVLTRVRHILNVSRLHSFKPAKCLKRAVW